jgi:glycosyltransferase involved in cell wall biosynthesis
VTRDVHLLTFTSLYPSIARPRHGIFIESRLQGLLQRGGLRAHVVAPVPWFPFTGSRWGEYGRMARTPHRELRNGIGVRYPRYLSLPSVGFSIKPDLMASAGLRAVESLLQEGEAIDLVDAHYLYPDGVAAAVVARRIGRPFLLSARGTDVNVIAQMPDPWRRIREAIEASSGVIAVSAALKASLVSLGVPADRVTVLRNGVDPTLFYPEDRQAARRELGLPDDKVKIVVSVGNLVPEKRHELALEAVTGIEGLHIVFVGRGPERTRLERMAHDRSVQNRVSFFDEMPQARLRWVYSAANALVLASEREGWPNILLEAAACGTPAVAFPVGGVPEILGDLELGVMVRGAHESAALADAIRKLLADPPSRDAVRAAAVRFGWEPVLEEQLALYRRTAQLDDEVPAKPDFEPARA